MPLQIWCLLAFVISQMGSYEDMYVSILLCFCRCNKNKEDLLRGQASSWNLDIGLLVFLGALAMQLIFY